MTAIKQKKHTPVVLACDPGTSGALAVVSRKGLLIDAFEMPLKEYGKKKIIDCDEVINQIEVALRQSVNFNNTAPKVDTVIERVSAMPGQGVTSMFNFGMAYGMMIAVLNLFEDPIFVTPKKWKEDLSLTEDKELTRSIATGRFGHASFWPRKQDHGIAEAALLGFWYWKHHKGYDL